MLPNVTYEITTLDAGKINIYRDSDELLKARLEGDEKTYLVKPVCCFPLTERDRYLALFQIDAEQKKEEELALISDLQRLDEKSRQLIAEELDRIYAFVWITKIYSMTRAGKVLRWDIEVQDGRRTFDVRDQGTVFTIQPNLIVIKDIADNRYLINTLELDPKSRSLLEVYC